LKNKFAFISILSLVALIVIGVLFYMNERSYHESFNQKFGSQVPKQELGVKDAATEKKTTPSLFDLAHSPPNLTPESAEKSAPQNFKENWKQVDQSLSRIARHCDAAERELLPDNSLIDINDPFFDNPDAVMAKYINVLHEALFAEGSMSAAMIWEEALRGDGPMNFKDIMKLGSKFEICRGQRSMVFIDSVFEAFSKKMWAPLMKAEFLRQTLDYLELRLQAVPPSAQNLAFSLNLLLGMSSGGLVPNEVSAELEDLYEKVIEAEDQGRELPKMDRRESVKVEMLRESWRNNKYLAGEIVELLRRIRRMGN